MVELASPNVPLVDVLVCVYNEAALIEQKLENLEALHYPQARLRVIVVDGGSDDDTVDRVRRWQRRHALDVEVCRTARVGKPAQINAGLARCRGDWVLVTDADARLPHATLRSMVDQGTRDQSIAVVGTAVRPASGHPLDHAHWTVVNALLRLEARIGSAGLVIGPCYLVRRAFFEPLPADTIADDVRVSCRTLLAGRRIACAPVTVTELRTPTGGGELFRHKVRKARAYMHEVRATLSSIRGTAPGPLAVFAWRAALLGLPPVALLGVLLAVAALGGPVQLASASLFTAVIGALSLRARPDGGRHPGWLRICVGLPLIVSLVLLAAIFTRPFTSVSPCYPRLQLADRGREV